MKKTLAITTAILALSSMNAIAASDYKKQGANTTATATVGETIDDAKIVTVINADLLNDKELSAVQINVDSDKGKVILRGIAPNVGAKQRAEKIASSVEGVVNVDNRLEVTNNGKTVGTVTNITKENIKDKSYETSTTVGTKIDDAAINLAVNAKLAADEELSSLKINVDVKKGKVWLKGTAPTLMSKNRATDLAKSVDGVKKVRNQLVVVK